MPHTQRFVDFRAIKAAVSIEQVLDYYGLISKFTRRGDSLSGPCPIHNGTNPTQFRVSLSKNCFNCFGDCKRGGNVLDFVALREGISVREAGLLIAEWFHLPAKEPSRGTGSIGTKPKETGDRIQSRAAQEDVTVEESGPNKPLGFQLKDLDPKHPYLADRGLTPATMTEFGVGYCAKGVMTGRIAIPIHNSEGKLVAYCGRLPGESTEDAPKYKLPSGFRKSQEVFNLHRAIRASDDCPLVIVEGFFDCMKLWQNGVRRVVSLMGSCLSLEQEELVRKVTHAESRILIMFDEDDAGRAGGEQALQRLSKVAYVKVVRFENEGQQPDDLSAEQLSAFLGSDSHGGGR